MKWSILLLIFIISCAPAVQEVTTKPVVEKQPEAPVTQPVLEPEVKAPQEVPPPQPVREPERQLSPYEECIEACGENCKATAQNACTQKGRPACKEICDDNPTIDPSACTQACTYISQPSQCKVMMENFCSTQCVKQCH